MALSIQTNVNSLVSQENLRVNTDFQAKTIARLTSGYRINSSGDDAAGLAVANKFRSDTTELTQGVRNANDGISQLQIIDGGLANISKMLDRMKTLATQSASGTFSGDRSTLDNEYQALIKEVNRQAANINLDSGGKYNTNISVYIGGGNAVTGGQNGTAASNAQVSIDLSGTANQVDAAGLDIDSTSVSGGGVTLGTGAPASGVVTTATTLDFFIDGKTTAVQVTASANKTVADAVKELNEDADAIANGLTFSVQADSATGQDKLVVSSSHAFSVSGTGAATDLLGANVNGVNTAKYNVEQASTFVASTNTGTQKLVFSVAGGGTATVDNLAMTDLDTTITQINAQTSALGIQAVKIETAGGNFKLGFQSDSFFNVAVSNNGTITSGQGISGAADLGTMTAADTDAAAGGKALDALSKLSAAVSSLGKVQGIVGTAQNKLSYAINLANSQITNFSAAESRIRDTDVAVEAANLTKAQVLSQASMAAMAQANSAPQQVLSLLRG